MFPIVFPCPKHFLFKLSMDVKQPREAKKTKQKSNGVYCIIPGCNNRFVKDKELNIKRSYFRIPPTHSKQYKAWMKNNRLHLSRTWECTDWDRICADHFIGGIFQHFSYSFLYFLKQTCFDSNMYI